MKIARFRYEGQIHYGTVNGIAIHFIEGDVFGSFRVTSKVRDIGFVELLPPAEPKTILAAARNYVRRAQAGGRQVFPHPEFFLKTPASITGPEGTIVIPPDTEHIVEEGELVVVIGKRCKRVRKEEAPDYVLGYTLGNDVSARDWQHNDLQWWRAKSSDTFSPIGPFIITDLDPSKLELSVKVNRKEVQRTTTDQLVHDVPTMVSFASQVITLEPGDLIFTGTPDSAAALKDGDVVEVECWPIGVLRNYVRGLARG